MEYQVFTVNNFILGFIFLSLIIGGSILFILATEKICFYICKVFDLRVVKFVKGIDVSEVFSKIPDSKRHEYEYTLTVIAILFKYTFIIGGTIGILCALGYAIINK